MRLKTLSRAFGEVFVVATTIATIVTNLPDSVIDFHRIHSRSPYSFPNWRFFGPLPGTVNVYLYARSMGSDGIWSDWYSLVPEKNRSRLPILSNSGNRNEKALIDLASTFSSISSSPHFDHEALVNSDPYIRLLRIGRSLDYAFSAWQAQLMLVEVHPRKGGSFDEPSPVVVTDAFQI